MENYVNELYKSLVKKYGRESITKKELANELNLSVRSIDNRIAIRKDLPNFIKLGSGKNSSVRFPLIEVANFLTNTQKCY